MKQHIEISQLNELSEKGKERLREWWKPEVGDIMSCNCDSPLQSLEFEEPGKLLCRDKNNVGHSLPLLSIGQMIEFLDEHKAWASSVEDCPGSPYVGGVTEWGVSLNYWSPTNELCDALWEAVKEVLEK